MKARKELEEWEENVKKQKKGAGKQRAPGLTMSVVMQSRASFSNGKSVGVDGISADILKTLPWRALQKIKNAFELRYKGQNKEDIETWLRNIIVLIPKKKVIEKLEGQTRGICVQSVLAKWYCGCLTILMEMEMKNVGRRDKVWENLHTFGFEEGRSATGIPTGILLMAAAAQESGADLGLVVCSVDVKQVFDNVSPASLSLIMKEMDIAPMLAGAILREQIGGRYDICFQETRVSGIPFDKSTKQDGKESPSLFNVMMSGVFKPLQEKWKEERMGVKMRTGEGQQEEYRVDLMIFADNCYLFASSKEEIRTI